MTTEYSRFSWRDTGRGTWVRDIDEPEAFYSAIARLWEASGRQFFYMTGHLSLKVAVPEDQSKSSVEDKFDAALSKAWLALRFDHPSIAAQVKFDPETGKHVKQYPVDSDGWIDQTFVRISTGQTGMEWANSDPPAPPLSTLNVVSPPSTDDTVVLRDLVLRSPHDIIDGIGTLILFDNYVSLASTAFEKGDAYEPPFLQDPRIFEKLSPPFRVAAAVPSELSERSKARLASIAESKANAPSNVELASLPYKKGALVPGVHKRVEITLPPEETSKVTTACKRMHVSVTHAFHAGLALALRDLQAKSDTARLVQHVGYLLRNERGCCLPPYNDHRHPTGVYHSTSAEKLVVEMTVPGRNDAPTKSTATNQKAEFDRIVRQMSDFYIAVRDDKEHYALVPHLFGQDSPPLPENGEHATAVPPPSDAPSASISSMGRIDNIIAQQRGAIQTYHPWVTGEELRSGLGLFLGGFRGELCLSAAYNDAWHSGDGVMEFLCRCLDIVKAGLGI